MAWDDIKAAGNIIFSADWNAMVVVIKAAVAALPDQGVGTTDSPTFVGLTLSGLLTLTPDTFADGDATPDVSAGIKFLTANTGATTITDFLNGTNALLIVIAGDNNTIIAANANIKLNAGSDLPMGEFDCATFIHNGSLWVLQSYAQNSE